MADPRSTIWTQFILAAAAQRLARPVAERACDEMVAFSYTDTHGGPGLIDGKLPGLDQVIRERGRFANRALLDALPETGAPVHHPGSWVLVSRVVEQTGGPGLAVEMDVNDLDPQVVVAAKANREGGWVRLWSHDWFLFLRSRLNRPERPHLVFVDPPEDDARGPGYGIDAAILMDTLKVPYMISYPVVGQPQDCIDQIGRTGLELHLGETGFGVLLGGGAETVFLDVYRDLNVLAELLGGTFHVRLPQGDDYVI